MKKQGFTLLELLIVVVIIGVLALIAAPSLLNATDEARDGTVKANVSAAASSITSRFALSNNLSATDIATEVANELGADNVNPVDDTAAAFDVLGTAAGSVVLAGDNSTDEILITGYGQDGSAIITKVVSSPQDN